MNIAIVTGASSGMGREFVLRLSGCVRPIPLDLCDSGSFDTIERLLAEEKPNIRLLVNAAGFGKFGAYHEVSLEDEVWMVKLVPHSIVMNIWLNQQKKSKNNKGLTTK